MGAGMRLLIIMGIMLLILLVLLGEAALFSFAWNEFASYFPQLPQNIATATAFWGLIVVRITGYAFNWPSRGKKIVS